MFIIVYSSVSSVVFSSLVSMLVSMYSLWAYKVSRILYLLHCLSFLTAGWCSWCIQVYNPVSLTSSPCIASDLVLLPMVILSFAVFWDRWSTWHSSRNCWRPERLSENLSAACSITVYSCASHSFTTCTVTSCTLFDYVIMGVIKKWLHLISWHNAFKCVWYLHCQCPFISQRTCTCMCVYMWVCVSLHVTVRFETLWCTGHIVHLCRWLPCARTQGVKWSVYPSVCLSVCDYDDHTRSWYLGIMVVLICWKWWKTVFSLLLFICHVYWPHLLLVLRDLEERRQRDTQAKTAKHQPEAIQMWRILHCDSKEHDNVLLLCVIAGCS